MNRKKFTEEVDINHASMVSQYDIKARRKRARYMFPTRKKWTKEEDDIIKSKFNELGPKWAKISTFFKNRSTNDVKNRWKYLQNPDCIHDPGGCRRTKDQDTSNDDLGGFDISLDTFSDERGFDGNFSLYDVTKYL